MTKADIGDILRKTRTIAVIGLSANPARPSHGVAKFLQDRGYRIVPVNPGLAGQTLLGEVVYGAVTDIPFAVDMVDIFRRSDAVPNIVTAALTLKPAPDVVWMQLGVRHAQAAADAEAAGLTVVQDRCPKIDYMQLFGLQRVDDIGALRDM